MSSRGLTIAEAAEALGLSERTIRRQIKSGKIKAELVLGRYGAEYRISGLGETAVARPRVDKAPASALDKTPASTLDKAPASALDKAPASALDKAIDKTLDKALDMVKALQQEKAELYAQVAYWQAQFQHLEEQVKLLTEAKRPWWRRWLSRRR